MIPFLFHLCASVSSPKPARHRLGFQGAIVFSIPSSFQFLGTPALQTFKFIFCPIYTLPSSSLSNEFSRHPYTSKLFTHNTCPNEFTPQIFLVTLSSLTVSKSTPSRPTEADEPISFTGKGCGPGRDFGHGLPADGFYDTELRFLVSGKHESVS